MAKPPGMTLDEYLSQPDAMTLTALSVEVGISKGRLSQLRAATDWPPDLALRVERATEGKVCASALSPVIAQARVPAPQQDAAA